MSNTPAATQDDRASQSAKRRKRKERTGKARAPEPKDIVSGAGQPLDPSVRRDLEEQLGHDLGQVRLHTDRDAGHLTELLGADAVAVGQDIFFRENTYRPGTTDGQRLLAHELLHTVQNPHGLGALRAGRDLGAVSLPQDAMEREAEGAARELVRGGRPDTETEPQTSATPGWLRYATVDADRNRMEKLDPATLVDRLANGVIRSLRGDPEDRSQRTRVQLERMPDEVRDAVLDRLETRLLSSEHERVLDFVDEIEADGGLERESLAAPDVEPDSVEELLFERETGRRRAEERREEEQRPVPAPGPEKDQHAEEGAPGSTPQNGGGAPEQEGHGGSQEQRPGADAGREGGSASSGGKSGGAASAAPAAAPPSQQPSSSSPSGGKPGGGQRGGEKTAEGSEKGKQGKEREGKEGQEQQGVATASKEESAAKNRPGAADALVAGQQLKQQDKRGTDKPTGSPTVSGKDTQSPGAFSTLDGVRAQDLDGPEERAEEDPFGSGSESEVEVGGEEKSAWDTKLQPEDFLPEQDLDVSGVPTADTLDPASSATPPVPSFPAPPVTKADKVQAERDAEDAEDEAADAEPDEDTVDAGAEAEPSVEADDGAAAVGGGLGDLAVEQAAESRPGPAVTRDPKSGADPKDGPVVAQTTVQEAAGRSEDGSEATEQAAKEEKGTPAAGDAPGGAQEKASQQAVGGQAAQEPAARAEQKKTDAEPAAAKSEPTADADSPSPARDTQVTGGSNADTPGGASSGAQSEQSAPAERTEAPAAESASSAPEPTKTAGPEQTAQPTPAPAPSKGTPAPKAASGAKAAAPKSAPSARTPRGGGGSGGGGRASAPAKGKKKDSGPAPNLSQVSPEAGLSTASKLKPHVALQAMTGVSGSVDRTVGDEHKALAAAPPSMQRPAGAPQTLQGKPATDAAAQYSQDPAQKSEAPEQEDAEVTGAKEPEGQIEAEKAEEPGGWDTFKMALGFIGGKIVNGVASLFGADEPVVDPQELAAKFAGLPTKDEALKQAQAGNAPGVQMRGDADQTAGEQGSAVDTKGQETVATGRDDAGRGMGEDQVYPDAPKEQMAAKVPGQGGGGGGGAPGGGATTGAVPPEAASEVAEHERGPQFQAAFTDGQKGMSEGRQTKDRDFRDGQQKHKQQVDAEVAGNTKSQANEREKAMTEVTAKRADWRTEQDKELQSLGDKKTERHEKIRKDVKDKEEQTDKDVDKEKEDSDKKIQDKGDQAERDAEKKRDDSVQESGNWISKAFEWIKNKVIEIKKAIVRVIREARDAVVNFIKNFKETVERWINDARKAIVDAIKNFINDLIEFAKAMVRAVIDLAKRVRDFITGLINAAIALVNKLATMLKQAITDLLNALGKLLSSILDVLKKMLQDVVKAVVDAVKAVLDFASKLLGALGDFMLIAVDFLSDPGGWLSGAKNSAVDGAKNHLFREVKSAVKEWFQSKIQEIIGVPKAILDKLFKGGFTLEQIVKETWDAIVPQLPFIIGEIVITKVIAKLIPGAGWVMAVIDAIRTAIGALGAILRAMGAVLDWLKLVRMGGAGLLFAKAVAAGIVALLELAYQALLSGIGKYVAKVGRRFKAIAAKLGQGKGGKGATGGKGGADGEGADGRGGKPKPDEKPQEPTAPKTTARPTPTTTKPKPGAEPTPKKPTTQPQTKPTKADTPGRSKTTPGTKTPAPTTKDKNGKPKPEEAHPDTRPTPSPKPKPKPEPPAKPKPEPQTRPKPDKDDKTPGTLKDDKGPEDRPKNDDEPSTKDPKDQDPTKPKPGKDDPKRPKPDEDGKGKKDVGGSGKKDMGGPGKKGAHGKQKKDGGGKRSKHSKGDHDNDRDMPGRPKSTKAKRDRKNEEKSDREKSKRLALIIARIRPIIKRKTKHGMLDSDTRAMLTGMLLHYRLKRLYGVGAPEIQLHAGLSPTRRFEDLHQEQGATQGQQVDFDERQEEPPLPPTKLPTFKDGPEKAPSLKAHHIKKSTPKGTEADERPNALPKGWDAVSPKYSKGGAWVRMHLLPAQLGGEATTSNLVPARGTQNKDAANEIEHPAIRSLGNPIRKSPWRGKINKMIWYDVNVSYYDDDKFPGFPSSMTITWGGYDHPRGHWQRDPATGIWSRGFQPPPNKDDIPSSPVANVNHDDAHAIRLATGISAYFAKRISRMTEPNRGRSQTFANMAALTRALNKGQHLSPGESDETRTGGSHKNRLEALARIKKAAKKGRLTF